VYGATSYLLAKALSLGHEGWSLFLRAALVGYLTVELTAALFFVERGLNRTATLNDRQFGVSFIVAVFVAGPIGIAISTASTLAVLGGMLGPLLVLASAALLGLALGKAIAGIFGLRSLKMEASDIYSSLPFSGVRSQVLADKVQKTPQLVAIFGTLALVTAFVPLALGISLRAVAVRIAATLSCLPHGLRALSANFRRTLFGTDMFSRTELVPGCIDLTSDDIAETLGKTRSRLLRGAGRVTWVIVVVPAFFYRFSIKSTCWLYWPLAYVSRAPLEAVRPSLFLDDLIRGAWSKMQRRIAWAMLAAFLATNLVVALWRSLNGAATEVSGSGIFFRGIYTALRYGLEAIHLPPLVAPFEYLFFIDFGSLSLWTWLNLINALITLGPLWYGAERVKRRHDFAEESGDEVLRESATKQAILIEYCALFRNVLGIALAAIYFVHAMLVFSSIPTCLSNGVLRFLTWFFGRWMPSVTPGECFLSTWAAWMPIL
jgi:hypothetical protein